MLTIEQIKDILFSSEQNQTYFIVKANEHGIPGDTFDEKLNFLLYEADEQTLQIILAPALRARTIAYMQSDAAYTQQVCKENIHVMGTERWNAQCDPYQEKRDSSDTRDFITAKQDFIKRCMPKSSLIEAAATEAFSTQETDLEQEWLRLIFDQSIQGFLERRSFFINKYGEPKWEQLLHSVIDDKDASEPSAAKNDFEEIKTHFLDRYDASQWDIAKALSAAKLATFEAIKQQFIEKSGTRSWNTYLIYQSDPCEHATDIEAKALAHLFDLGFSTTPITNDIQQTTIPAGTSNPQTIHMYCVNNIHWHVYGNGYYHTIGDGACLYNGFAQCFRLLLKGRPTNPAQKISLQQTEIDARSVLALQKQIGKQHSSNTTSVNASDVSDNDPNSLALSVQTAFEDMQDIRAMRKELDLFNDESPIAELKDLLKSKASLLIRLIQQKNWSCHTHIQVLQGIISLADDDTSSQEHCVRLKSLLQTILNTLYLPRTDMQNMEWDEEAYRNNLQTLKGFAIEITASNPPGIQALGLYILHNQFDTLHQQRSEAPQKPERQHSASDEIYGYAINPPPPTNDFFSASLLLTGMFMMVAGLTALIMLLGLILSSSTTVVGTLLLHTGLNSIATNLSAIIGWSLPNSAVAVATVASSMITACGFTLFRDNVPSPSGQEIFTPLQWILG